MEVPSGDGSTPPATTVPNTTTVEASETTTGRDTTPTTPVEMVDETEPSRGGDTGTPADVPSETATGGQVILTDEERTEIDTMGWVAVDLDPVDCSGIELDVAAVAYADDFSAARSSSATDHVLMMDYGSMIRRIDTYLTLPASDGHMHEIVFSDAALVALLDGTSLVTRTTTAPIDGDDSHGHMVTVHSCGDMNLP